MTERNILTFYPGSMAGSPETKVLFRAPSSGGGLTITGAYVTNGAADAAGTAFTAYLVNYGSTGTVAGGTIASAGGTTDHWAADVPKAMTLTAANAYIDSGEWVVLKKTEVGASSDFTDPATITIEYVEGIVTQG